MIVNKPRTTTKSSQQKKSAPGDKRKNLFFLGGIIVFSAFLYSNSLNNGFVNWDDYQFIFENPFIKNFSWQGIKEIFTIPYDLNYHPISTLTWLLEFSFKGYQPFIYHFTNIVLHLINVYLVYVFILKLLKNNFIALFTTFFFSIHPMHVESVSWISERRDMLYTLFFLLSIIHYINFSEKRDRKYLAYSLILFLFSLLSKSMAVTLPLVLIVLDHFYLRKRYLIMTRTKYLL